MFKNLINIITSPNETFQDIQAKPSVWFPFLLLIGSIIFTQVWVMNTIDFDYFVDSMVEQIAEQRGAPESEIRQGMDGVTPGRMAGFGAVGGAITVSLMLTIYAAYLNLITKLGDDKYSFKTFFSLVCWTSIPSLFNSIAAVLNTVISSSGQLTQQQLNPLSFNSLLFNTSGPYANLLSSLTPTTIWSAVLLLLGYKFVTNCSMNKAALVTLTPVVLIFGGWTLFILLGS